MPDWWVRRGDVNNPHFGQRADQMSIDIRQGLIYLFTSTQQIYMIARWGPEWILVNLWTGTIFIPSRRDPLSVFAGEADSFICLGDFPRIRASRSIMEEYCLPFSNISPGMIFYCQTTLWLGCEGVFQEERQRGLLDLYRGSAFLFNIQEDLLLDQLRNSFHWNWPPLYLGRLREIGSDNPFSTRRTFTTGTFGIGTSPPNISYDLSNTSSLDSNPNI